MNTFAHCSSLESIIVDGENTQYASVDGVLFDKNMQKMLVCPGGKTGDYVIPSGVVSITDAFFMCSKLTGITISENVSNINNFDFLGCNSLESFIVDGANESYASLGGVLFDKGYETIIACPAGKDGIYEIPEGVNSIAPNAFRGCKSLVEIMIPESVTNIGEWAFSECSSLTTINLPAGMTSIPYGLFHQ